MEILIEALLAVGLIYLSIVPHEIMHKLVMKYYGIDTHFEFKTDVISVVPNDEESLEGLTRKSVLCIASSGGLASVVTMLLYCLMAMIFLTFPSVVIFSVFLVYYAWYTIWETKLNLNLNPHLK